MRHNPAAGAVAIMLRTLKMHGMSQAVGELTEQGSPAFEAAPPILSQLLEGGDGRQGVVIDGLLALKAARFPNYRDLAGFDLASSEVNEALAQQLHRCEFLEDAHNVVLVGGPGHGKTHSPPRSWRPGHRASPQARKFLLHRRTRQRSRTREASGQTWPDRGTAHPL